jgi:hypothetical protein
VHQKWLQGDFLSHVGSQRVLSILPMAQSPGADFYDNLYSTDRTRSHLWTIEIVTEGAVLVFRWEFRFYCALCSRGPVH